METSILIAKILGIIYMSFGIGSITSKEYYKKMFDKLFDNSPVIYLSGIICVTLGLIMLEYHNTWNGDWTDIITVMCWAVLVKGIMLLIFPNYLNSFKSMIGSKFISVLALVLGFIFVNFGFLG